MTAETLARVGWVLYYSTKLEFICQLAANYPSPAGAMRRASAEILLCENTRHDFFFAGGGRVFGGLHF